MVLEPANIRSEVQNNEENRNRCHCPLCPSYSQECPGEILYCGTQASKCDINPQTCLCDTCPVYYEYGLKGLYYCNLVEAGKTNTLMRKKRSDEDEKFYQTMLNIREESLKEKSITVSMGSQKKLPFPWTTFTSSLPR